MSTDTHTVSTPLHDEQTQAFNDWCAQQYPPLRLSSETVYRALWLRFIEWLGSKKTDLCQLNTALIQEFLASTQVKREQRERYQLIITSVYEHWHNADQAVSSNVCTSDINDPFRQIWRNVEGNNKRSFLTSEEVAALEHTLEQAKNAIEQKTESFLLLTAAKRWLFVRDTAMVALLFYSGIHAGELLPLSADCIEYFDTHGDTASARAGRLNLEKYHGIDRSLEGKFLKDPHADALHIHRITLRKIALPALCVDLVKLWQDMLSESPAWVTTRTGEVIASSRLFPSYRTDGSNALTDAMLNSATLARVVTKWGVKQAGIQRLTAQRLRNTRAALWIEEGMTLPQLDEQMGFSPGAASGFRLQQDWLAFKDSVPSDVLVG